MDTPTSYDPLLSSLLFIAEQSGVKYSLNSLLAGLPLVNGKLNPELAVKVAERLGRRAKVVERKLRDIPQEVLPCILLLNDNQCALLLADDDGGRQLKRMDQSSSEQNMEVTDVELKDLSANYSGFAIFVSYSHSKNNFQEAQNTELVKGSHKDQWFWQTLWLSKRIYRDVLLATFFINMFALAMPLFVMNVYDRVVPNEALESLWVLAIGVVLVTVFDFILRTLRVYFVEIAGKKSDILLSSHIFSRVVGADYTEHPRSSGIFSNQLREFESIRAFVTSAVVTSLVDLPFVLLFLIIIAYVGGGIVWVPLIAGPILLAYSWWVQRKLKASVLHSLDAAASKNATLIESVSGLETLKSVGAEGKALWLWESAVARLAHWGLKSRILSASAMNAAAFVTQFSSVAVVVIGVYAISERQLTLGALVASVLLVGRVMSPFANVANLLVQYQQAKFALESLSSIVNKKQERPESRRFIHHEKLKGKIEFKQVVFSYPDEKVPALKDLNFSITAGEKVAIVGRLGSGKSSLQRLILGLYRPTAGLVLVDDLDISQIDPAVLRNNMGFLPQDNFLFSGSIRENIAYGSLDVDDSRVVRVADIAGVSEFTRKHPLGLERQVGERGMALSGGQRQSICLARALLRDPPVLLLDEPSSSLDSVSELRLIENLKKFSDTKTLLLVTHRTSLLPLVDRIIVLDEGKVIADGPRDFVIESLKKGQLRAPS